MRLHKTINAAQFAFSLMVLSCIHPAFAHNPEVITENQNTNNVNPTTVNQISQAKIISLLVNNATEAQFDKTQLLLVFNEFESQK